MSGTQQSRNLNPIMHAVNSQLRSMQTAESKKSHATSLDIRDQSQSMSYLLEPNGGADSSMAHVPPQKSGQFSLDSCLLCMRTRDSLQRLLTQLKGTSPRPPSGQPCSSVEQIMEAMEVFVTDLLEKDREVEQQRAKVNQDVEKLIQNQESFERRVQEMDSVYAMLMAEQKKLREKRHHYD